ncbi:hypothetical protein IE81DRAFT_365037 [Ceraceosorus guamensis]|uniref:Uncharacterized protein n=1 Tax=Ceraceosorus guamensis TaxID=1522189 RepID=A0A316W5B8_9BASI|nr:hypothetical protein IE81DRAFT_365037 [Ceraceosorus guamensis]PWN44288.1 hypothetical protein IE81DRAFT_365037 [Ceraceosorus guamensis]
MNGDAAPFARSKRRAAIDRLAGCAIGAGVLITMSLMLADRLALGRTWKWSASRSSRSDTYSQESGLRQASREESAFDSRSFEHGSWNNLETEQASEARRLRKRTVGQVLVRCAKASYRMLHAAQCSSTDTRVVEPEPQVRNTGAITKSEWRAALYEARSRKSGMTGARTVALMQLKPPDSIAKARARERQAERLLGMASPARLSRLGSKSKTFTAPQTGHADRVRPFKPAPGRSSPPRLHKGQPSTHGPLAHSWPNGHIDGAPHIKNEVDPLEPSLIVAHTDRVEDAWPLPEHRAQGFREAPVLRLGQLHIYDAPRIKMKIP